VRGHSGFDPTIALLGGFTVSDSAEDIASLADSPAKQQACLAANGPLPQTISAAITKQQHRIIWEDGSTWHGVRWQFSHRRNLCIDRVFRRSNDRPKRLPRTWQTLLLRGM
jgi:hypothetical protein